MFARTEHGSKVVDQIATDLRIHELPAARGCTYVAPAEHFGLALSVGQQFSESGGEATARKFLGLTDEELEALCQGTIQALAEGPLDPHGIKKHLGELVRNLGEEGKKRGQTTFLANALAKLQREGQVRRISANGRLDSQSYRYALWTNGPEVGNASARDDAYRQLAQLYFDWIGLAKLSHFQWFSGLGVAASKKAIEALDLVALGADLIEGSATKESWLIHRTEVEAFQNFHAPNEPQVRLISSLDGLFLLRRDFLPLVDAEHRETPVFSGAKQTSVGILSDLPNNAIVDRGQVIGLWEYDSFAGKIAYFSFVGESEDLKIELDRVETMIRNELGDARNFSLDSPESRKPYVDALRSLKR